MDAIWLVVIYLDRETLKLGQHLVFEFQEVVWGLCLVRDRQTSHKRLDRCLEALDRGLFICVSLLQDLVCLLEDLLIGHLKYVMPVHKFLDIR